PLADRGSPGRTHGNAVANPRIRANRGSEMLWGGRRGRGTIVATEPTECPMPQANDLSRCLLTLEQDSTLIAVVELSQASWLVAGIVPAVERQPLKKIEADEA